MSCAGRTKALTSGVYDAVARPVGIDMATEDISEIRGHLRGEFSSVGCPKQAAAD